MTDLHSLHADHGATFTNIGGREVVAQYRRPERTHQAIRNGVGVIEMPYGVITVEGSDRIDYVDNVVTNRVPTEEGVGTYAFLLDPQGRIETDLTIYNGGDRLLLFCPPGRADPTVDGWETFIQDVSLEVASDAFAVFGIHGPQATEKVASVLAKVSTPTDSHTFVRGSIGDFGVTVARVDAPAGEEGYEVITTSEQAAGVFDALLTHGMNAVPFGRDVWETLTLEAGTPLFASELDGRIPNVTGVQAGIDYEKGCFIGQEVVSKVQNRGRPSSRLVGLSLESEPAAGSAVFAGDAAVGEVTRASPSPIVGSVLAFAYVDFDLQRETVSVRVEGEEVPATIEPLPFVEGSQRSARIPTYSEPVDAA